MSKTNKSDRPKWLTDARYRKLGTVPDWRIAGPAGVHPSTVGRWRRRLGIPGFCPGRRKGLFG